MPRKVKIQTAGLDREAIRYNENAGDSAVEDFIGPERYAPDGDRLFINTREGLREVRDGDWIIRGVNNEPYPFSPERFDKRFKIIT